MALIDHAFGQWSAVTNGQVTTIRERYTASEVFGDPALDASMVGTPKPCADYARLIGMITSDIQRQKVSLPGITIGEIETNVTMLLARLKTNGGEFVNLDMEDDKYNEVLMFDDVSGLYNVLNEVAFSNIAVEVGNSKGCWFQQKPGAPTGTLELNSGALMCTDVSETRLRDATTGQHLGSEYTSDIIIRRGPFQTESLTLPASDARFSACPNKTDRAYSAFLHEAGHALAIGGGDKAGWDSPGHPNNVVTDTIMGITHKFRCAPTPFDKMAIYALYQTK